MKKEEWLESRIENLKDEVLALRRSRAALKGVIKRNQRSYQGKRRVLLGVIENRWDDIRKLRKRIRTNRSEKAFSIMHATFLAGTRKVNNPFYENIVGCVDSLSEELEK